MSSIYMKKHPSALPCKVIHKVNTFWDVPATVSVERYFQIVIIFMNSKDQKLYIHSKYCFATKNPALVPVIKHLKQYPVLAGYMSLGLQLTIIFIID